MNPLTLNTNNGSVGYALNLLAGKYKFMVMFESDGYYDSSNYTFDVNVVKTSTNVVASNMNASTVVKAIDGKIGKYLKMTLKDANGKALVGKTVIFTFNDLTFSRVTNKSGVARLQINIATAGTYSFKISFAGDEKFSASSKAEVDEVLAAEVETGGKVKTLVSKGVNLGEQEHVPEVGLGGELYLVGHLSPAHGVVLNECIACKFIGSVDGLELDVAEVES